MKDFTCKYASNGLMINWDGTLAPCCQYNYVDKDLPLYKYNQQQQFEQNTRSKIVSDLKRGLKHEGCRICWQQEKLGATSLRQSGNEDKDQSGAHLEIRLGNHCNLKCVMCGPYASTLWFSEMKKNAQEFMQTDSYTLRSKSVDNKTVVDAEYYTSTWHTHETVVDFVKQNIDQLTSLNLSGGEPFLVPTFHKILDVITNSNKRTEFTLQINTNGTILDKEHMLSLLRLPCSIRIIFSLEGVGKHNDYIRYPSKWNEINENIKNFIVLRDNLAFDRFELLAQHTLQPSSIYAFPELVSYCESNQIEIILSPVFHSQISLGAITESEKQQFKVLENNSNDFYNRSAMHSASVMFDSAEFNEVARDKYKKYVNMLDKIRNTNYESVFGPL